MKNYKKEAPAKTRIVIVEDEGIVAKDLEKRLTLLGYTVAGRAVTGEDAVETVGVLSPDMVLMDIMLKGEMDGIEAAAQIHQRYDIPVIFLTAYTDMKTLERAKVTQPFGYIVKPFEERDIHTAIEMAVYKHEMEQRLKQSERWLSKTLTSIGDAVIATDKDCRIAFMNPVAEDLTGWKERDALGRPLEEVFHVVSEEVADVVELQTRKVLREGTQIGLPNRTTLMKRSGEELSIEIPIDDSAAPIFDDKGKVTGMVIVFRDHTEARRSADVREALVRELTDALAKIKSLKGLIPICASCKKIRDDKGFWNQLEQYICEHSDANFTHGLCPDCLEDFKKSI